jgi:predicted nucleic acid-binding Zn ribbon protein
MPWEPLPGRRDADPASVAMSLDRVVRHLGAPSADVTASLVGRWDQLVGPNVGANTRPIRLRDGTLTVAVAEPGWATQLRFLEATLVERLCAELGAGAVRTIEVRVRPESLRDKPQDGSDRA